jgi:hypothetical protein
MALDTGLRSEKYVVNKKPEEEKDRDKNIVLRRENCAY